MAYCVSGNYTISGCLGVGIDPAAYRLDLYTTGQSDGIRITSTNSKPMLRFYSTYNDASNRNWEMSPNGQVFGDFEIAQSAAKDGDAAGGDRNVRFYIKNDGNVGIGLTTPCGALDAYKAGSGGASGAADNLIVRGGNNNNVFTGNQIRFGYAGGIGYSHAIKSRHNSGANAQNALDFFLWNTTDCTETTGTKNVMTLDGTGNVGIGTCMPANALHIYRASGFATMALQVGGNYGYFLANGCCMGIASDAGATGIKFHINRQAPDDAMLITQAGNVGINCTSPSYKLHVNGTFYAAGSSCEYKTQICQYNTDSCMFMKLKPVTYQYKDEYCHLGKELKSETQIGLIAEEVAESHPELAILVNEEDEKVVRNVDYEKLTIILLSELQKLRQEVDQLKNK
jgi:hypothetical protein